MKELMGNLLFKGLDQGVIENICKEIHINIKNYGSNQLIFSEEESCNNLGIILEGEIEIQRIYLSGKHLVLKKLTKGDVFGEALIYLKESKYPATVVSCSKSKILFINKDEMLKLLIKNQVVLENFIELLSSKVLMLNNKIKSISYKSVKEKVINYLLDESKCQKSLEIKLRESKEEISVYLGIPRPSFSRELIKLKEKGLIEYDRKEIKIKEINLLEDELNL